MAYCCYCYYCNGTETRPSSACSFADIDMWHRIFFFFWLFTIYYLPAENIPFYNWPFKKKCQCELRLISFNWSFIGKNYIWYFLDQNLYICVFRTFLWSKWPKKLSFPKYLWQCLPYSFGVSNGLKMGLYSKSCHYS